MRQHIILGEVELIVQYLEKLALDSSNIPCTKDTSSDCPSKILQCRIVDILIT